MDPIFGIIPEKFLGLDPVFGKPKIAQEVLEGMRTYLMVADGPEKVARAERVRKSLVDLENDPIGRKTSLMLEAPPSITTDLDKGKGVVFDFSKQGRVTSNPDKLMASAISVGMRVLQFVKLCLNYRLRSLNQVLFIQTFIRGVQRVLVLVPLKLVLPGLI